MSDQFDAEALWLKARLFLNHAMDDDNSRDFDERALWASLALELLAKAALSRHSPVLIADVKEDGANILAASGLTPATSHFISVTAKTLMARCAKAFPQFSESQVKPILWARNNYLHGGAARYTSVPEDKWWPMYWAQAVILVHGQDRTLNELVGPTRVARVNSYLEQNKENVNSQTEAMISRAKQRILQLQTGQISARMAAQISSPLSLDLGLTYRQPEACPACEKTGLLEGEAISDVQVKREHDDPDYHAEIWTELTVNSDYFSCSNCRLVLDGFDFVAAAGLAESFIVVDDEDYAEAEYGND